MATASTNTTIAHNSTATFDTWINEIYTGLVTSCGLVQTADTGQMAVPSTAVYTATANTAVGYYVFQFNDTLQATSPVFFKLEFGTANSPNSPGMWITIGTSTNGAGTITGNVGTRVMVTSNTAPVSTITNYAARFVYNTTYGVCGLSWKIQGGGAGTNASLGGFYIHRSVSTAGAATATSVHMLTNSSSFVGGSTGNQTYYQIVDYSTGTVFGPAAGALATSWQTNWMWVPFLSLQTIQGTVGQIFPCVQYAPTASTPPFGITNLIAGCLLTEIPIGGTITATVLGSTSLTYMNVSSFTGCTYIGNNNAGASTYGVLFLWQ